MDDFYSGNAIKTGEKKKKTMKAAFESPKKVHEKLSNPKEPQSASLACFGMFHAYCTKARFDSEPEAFDFPSQPCLLP